LARTSLRWAEPCTAPAVTDISNMSLRAFHLLFITLSVILTAFFAAWAAGQYSAVHDVSYVIAAVGSLAAGLGLVLYGARFQRKTRNL